MTCTQRGLTGKYVPDLMRRAPINDRHQNTAYPEKCPLPDIYDDERSRIEVALRKSEERFRRVVEIRTQCHGDG